MARARNIKPALYFDEELAELPLSARYLFPGLWMVADREGRIEDRPKRIKAEIYPYDQQNVDQLLDKLVDSGHIVRYIVDDCRYIQILGFTKHQNPHKNEKPSEIPAYDPNRETSSNYRSAQVIDGTTRADSLSSDSLNTDTRTPSKNGATGFDSFWKEYPRKDAKKKALEAWEKINPDAALTETIIKAVVRSKSAGIWTERKFTPLPASYLNGERWTDDTKDNGQKPKSQAPPVAPNCQCGVPLIYDEDKEAGKCPNCREKSKA